MSLVRNSITIGGLTLVSRVLGLVRDMLMARFVGAGLASDAFLIAWRLPNLFRALFAEGAFAAVFVPLFNKKMTQAEREVHRKRWQAMCQQRDRERAQRQQERLGLRGQGR